MLFPPPIANPSVLANVSISCPITGEDIKYQLSVDKLLVYVTFPENVEFAINEPPFEFLQS